MAIGIQQKGCLPIKVMAAFDMLEFNAWVQCLTYYSTTLNSTEGIEC